MMRISIFVAATLSVLLTGSSLAQVESFDGATPGLTFCSTTNTGLPYNGWTTGPTGTSIPFRIGTGETTTSTTGPRRDLCGGGNYVYLESSCSSNPNTGWLASPVYTAANLTTPTLSFYYHMSGTGMGILTLEVSDGLGGWTPVWSLAGNQGGAWTRVAVGISTYDIGNGPETQIRFVGLFGFTNRSDMAIDQVEFGDPNPPPPPIHQGNSNVASLVMNGTPCFDFSSGSCPSVAPMQVSYDAGELMRWQIQSIANGLQPYALIHTPGFGANSASPGIPTLAGVVDFSLPGLSALEILIDGITPTRLVDLFLGDTTSVGYRTLEMLMPPGNPGSTVTTVQALVVDPTSPFGGVLSAATQVDRFPPVPAFPSLPGGATGGANLPGLTDDSTINYVFSSGMTFPFYGSVYSDCWINSNGSVSFGSGGDIDSSEGISDLESEEARIAPWWDDLNPAGGGAVGITDSPTTFILSFTDVPEYSSTGANSWGLILDDSGNIQVHYAAISSPDALVGITPGINSAVGMPNPGTPQPLWSAVPGSIVGAANDSIFDLFSQNPGYGIQRDSCGLSTGRTRLDFVPNPPLIVPGDAGYSAP